MGPVRQLDRRTRLLAWFGVLAAPVGWTLHLLIAYGYEEAACSTMTGVDAVTEVIVVTGVAFVALAIAGLAAASITWRGAAGGAFPDPRGRVGLMGIAGILGSVIFGFATVLETVLALSLSACAPG